MLTRDLVWTGAKLALAAVAILCTLILLLAPPPPMKPAEATAKCPDCPIHYAPTVSVNKTSVVVNEGPLNDNFGQAQEIPNVPGPGVDQWATVVGNTQYATKEAGESSPSLPGIDCGIYGTFNSVWYGITPPKDGWLYLTTEGSSFDTVLGLYEGASVSQLSQVDCSNENQNAPTSNWNDWTDKLSAKVAAGKTYYVQLSGTGGARSGAYTLKTRLHFGPGVWPPGDFRFFSASSPFNTPLSAYPSLKPHDFSTQIRNRIFSVRDPNKPLNDPTQGIAQEARPNHITARPSGTGGEPTYYSRPRDPDFTLHCEGDPFGAPDGKCPLEGKVIDIPAKAQVEGGPEAQLNSGADRHLTVIDQATGLEYDMWQVKEVKPKGSSTRLTVNELPAEGGDLYFSYGGTEAIYGDGLTSGRTSTAAHFASTAGRIRAEELEAGRIDHALFIGVECVNGKVWPATGNGQQCSQVPPERGGPLSGVNAPPLGARLWLNMTETEINNLKIDPWKKTILHAMREYGGYIGDTGSKGYFAIEAEAGVQYKVVGDNDKWYSFGEKNWELYTGAGANDYVAKLYKDKNDPGPGHPDYVNWDDQIWKHMVVLDECVTARTTPC